MRSRSIAALAVVLTLGALIAASSCSKQTPTGPFNLVKNIGNTPNGGSPQDSTPPPPPDDSVPPPPPVIVPVAFAGSESTFAGNTGQLRWMVGNDGASTFILYWTLTCDAGWPGFPKRGMDTLAAYSTRPVYVPVAVPSTAPTGMVGFQMTVTRPNGVGDTSADGWLRVYSSEPPPPPPPPPPPILAVAYVGADTALVGGSVTLYWQLTNESGSPFTMSWTLEGLGAPWPGLPQHGAVSLTGNEVRQIGTTTAIPDTAVTGTRWMRMTVTRPDGSAASADGPFILWP